MEKETTIAILAQIFSKYELCVITNRLSDASTWNEQEGYKAISRETIRIREIFKKAYEKAGETDYNRF